MKVAIIGTGYVGLVTGTCLAELGHEVTCIDVDSEKINKLNAGECPIYEPGLAELISKNVMTDTLFFMTDIAEIIDSVDIVFSAVGTPMGEDGSADLKYIKEVAHTFGKCINSYTVFVTKSTVPVGTSEIVRGIIDSELMERHITVPFDVVSNPEFLKEGSAVSDFMNPDRIVIGTDSITAKNMMLDLYSDFIDKILFTDIASAEMIKYASNAMLATRISFINEIANLCEKVGANVDCVSAGMGMDTRIGPKFLKAGCGYGGSCFPKDVTALIKTFSDNNIPCHVLNSVEQSNRDRRGEYLYNKIYNLFGGKFDGKSVGILGLSFKPGTDDVREAPAYYLIKSLEGKCKVKAYDPEGMDNFKKYYGFEDTCEYCLDMSTVFTNSDVVVIVTEWPEFINARWDILKNMMADTNVIDGRNCLDLTIMKNLGYNYMCVGKYSCK